MLECAAAIEANLRAQGFDVKVESWEGRLGPCFRVRIMDAEILCLVGRVWSTRARAIIKTAVAWEVEFKGASHRSRNRKEPAFWGGSSGEVFW